MDDIIVLILTLIFIVAGIFGQMKKQKLPPEKTGEAEPERQNFWDILDDDEEQPVGVTEHLKPAAEVAKENRFHSAGTLMKRDFTADRIQRKIEEPKPAAAGIKKFPLRKAVIYSEILNRKYF